MKILLIDDEKQLGLSLQSYMLDDGIELDVAFDGKSGIQKLEEESYEAVVTDLRMPGLDGMQVLSWIRDERPGIPVLMISAHGEIQDAVKAMKLGAQDYLVKPFDPDELVLRLKKAVEAQRVMRKFQAGMSTVHEDSGMIGESPKMKEIVKLLEKASPSSATILMTGESGTGKEVAARFIHERSGRTGPFLPVNMGAFPENLLESELFGFEKGAFTGADARKQGLFESAQGGTLFLDEIAELPLHLQVKLLRAIQERKIQRLGSVKSIPIDVRILAATNRDLEKDVKEGKFREDLYYRINVIRVRLPPLRERKEDIPLLVGRFIRRFSQASARKITGISKEALELLLRYDFPGNIRELENAIERACILAESDVLSIQDFDFLQAVKSFQGGGGTEAEKESSEIKPSQAAAFHDSPRTIEEMERQLIEAALKRNAFHREKTAMELGITRRTLLNKMKEYGLEPDA